MTSLLRKNFLFTILFIPLFFKTGQATVVDHRRQITVAALIIALKTLLRKPAAVMLLRLLVLGFFYRTRKKFEPHRKSKLTERLRVG